MAPRFLPFVVLPQDRAIARVLLFGAKGVVLRGHAMPTHDEVTGLVDGGDLLILGALDGEVIACAALPRGTPLPDGMAERALRSLVGRFDDVTLAMIGRASQVALWDDTHRHCGRCGTLTAREAKERCRRCPSCDLTAYPRLAPAVIVLVTRGEEALLARSSRFPVPFFSTLAGFVEPGETLEECVAREIHEEVGVRVKNLRYYGSQPWPFPHSLMIGFLAEHAEGEIAIDGEEIAEAAWFTRDALPLVPPAEISIAGRMIADWVARATLRGRTTSRRQRRQRAGRGRSRWRRRRRDGG